MASLSVNDIIDFAIVFIADEDPPKLIELPNRFRTLSGGWFTPCTDVVAGRVAALEGAGYLHVDRCAVGSPYARIRPTDAGLAYARGLTRKVAPQPSLAMLVWSGLQRSLTGRLGRNARSALMLELAELDAGLPSVHRLAANFAVITGPESDRP